MRFQVDLQPGLRCCLGDTHRLYHGKQGIHRQRQRHCARLASTHVYIHACGGAGRCNIASVPPVNAGQTCKRTRNTAAFHAAEAHTHSAGCSSGSSCGHGHDHYELKESWGPAQQFVFNRILQGSGAIKYSEFVAHSIAAAMSSAALLLISAFFVFRSSGCVLGSISTPESGIATIAALGSMALSAIPAFTDAIVQALDSNIDSHTLMAMAGIGSFLLGLPLEGALLFFLFHFAHVLESKFVSGAERSLEGLLDALPQNVRIVQALSDGALDWSNQQQVRVEDVAVGTLIVVKPGEVFPLDGTVMDGSALVGQENITGESVPVLKRKGSDVISGGQVYDGTLVVATTTRSSNSTTARIASMAQSAMQKKAKVEGFLTSITRRWSQVLIASTAALLASLLLLGVPLHGQHGALYRALAVLTAGAPCALALVPLAFVCAMSVLSRHGVLVKGSSVLDKLAGTSMIVLDKTGTLTEGRLRFVECVELTKQHESSSGAGDMTAIAKAAALSFQGTHPVCDAVLAEYGSRKQKSQVQLPHVVDFKLSPGAGMSGQVDDTWCLFGSEDYVQRDLSLAQRKALSEAVAESAAGKVCSVLVTGKRRGIEIYTLDVHSIHIFTFSDVPKWGSVAGVDAIRRMCDGIRVYTGDNAASAAEMVRHVGVHASEVKADLSPAQKAGLLAELQKAGNTVFMVGDGLNDAPALAQADVSAAFASSSESAVAGAADVILLQDGASSSASLSAPSDMGRVAFVLSVARAVRANVLQNLALAFMSMLCAVVPSVLGLLPLWSAVLLHEGSTVLVALNSCRLLLMRPVVTQAQS